MSFYPAKGGGKQPYYVAIDTASTNSAGGFKSRYYFDVSDIKKIELLAYSGTYYVVGDGLADITVTTYGSNNTVMQNLTSLTADASSLKKQKYTTKVSSKSYAGKNVNPSNPIDIPITTSYKSMCVEVTIPDYNFNGLAVYKVYPR